MQYLKKADDPPKNWRSWFNGSNGPCYIYDACYKASDALKCLLAEQYGLCAYCQMRIKQVEAHIEHVIPKSRNDELSTNYHNLVAVCKAPAKDLHTGRSRCDDERGNQMMIPLIFYNHFCCDSSGDHPFFDAVDDGKIQIKKNAKPEIAAAAEQFCNKLNINHVDLVNARKRTFSPIFKKRPEDKSKHRKYWEVQLHRIRNDAAMPHRQFLMMLMRKQIMISQ